MRVTVKESKQKEAKPFPKLMISNDGIIVLMQSQREGAVVKGNNQLYKVGHYSSTWFASNFQDFEGEITLSND